MNIFPFLPLTSESKVDLLFEAALKQVPKKDFKHWGLKVVTLISHPKIQAYFAMLLKNKTGLKDSEFPSEIILTYEPSQKNEKYLKAKENAENAKNATKVYTAKTEWQLKLRMQGIGTSDTTSTPRDPWAGKASEFRMDKEGGFRIIYCGIRR